MSNMMTKKGKHKRCEVELENIVEKSIIT
jgi:hypothetical protein